MTPAEIFKNEAPEVFDAYFNVIDTLSKRCPLDPKTRELVLLAILTVKESETGMPVHIDRALKAGATKEEIITVIISALPSCGMSTVIKGLKIAEDALNQLR